MHLDRRKKERRVGAIRVAVPQERRRVERRRVGREGGFLDRRQLPRPQRVLLVDDDAEVRAVWHEWLTLWGFTVIEADNGAVAIERALDRCPDLVLMDITMPVLDGISATERLKRSPATAHLPVLLLSADAMGSAPARARRAGADAFLPKPVRARELLEAIRTAFRRVIAERTTSATMPNDSTS